MSKEKQDPTIPFWKLANERKIFLRGSAYLILFFLFTIILGFGIAWCRFMWELVKKLFIQ